MKNHAFIFSALFITGALFPLPEFSIDVQTISSPKPRHLEEIAYDRKNNVLHMFGGAELHAQTWSEPSDLFQYSNAWKQYTTDGPLGRRGHALVYDEASRNLLMFGGVAQMKSGSDTVLFDMWRWANGKWSTINSKCPVKEPRAVYDPNAKRVLVYGDASDPLHPTNSYDKQKFELWEFKDGKWKRFSDKGPTAGMFPLAYNTKDKSLSILQWSESNLVLWEWKKNAWHTREFSSGFPPFRSKYAFSYSSTDNALLVFGGVDSKRELLGDFWKFDGKRWTQIQSNSIPSPRASLRLLDAGDRMMLYGGSTKSGLTNELWEFKNNTWTKL